MAAQLLSYRPTVETDWCNYNNYIVTLISRVSLVMIHHDNICILYVSIGKHRC